ncbi:MAG: 6-bladed beta-propeller [Tannerella sp.]|jgi:hypothetical protein|nr:6-bladed beta-propeller [Tannerella sp.]
MQKYLFFILLLFFFACGKKTERNSRFSEEQKASLHLDSTTVLKAETDSTVTIDLNPFLKRQHFDFGSLVREIKLLPLETTDESLVDDIYKVVVSDSNIYILDQFKGRGLIIFNRDGKFVKRMPVGAGPGELNRFYDFAYDTENNELIVYQHSFLMFFTPEGKYIRQERLPFGFFNFTVIPGGYLFKTLGSQGNSHLNGFEDYSLFVTDKEFKLESVGMYYPPKGKILTYYDYIYNNNRTIHITQAYSDTICEYITETGQLKARYVLDYRKKKLPERYLHLNSFDDFDKTIRQNDYYFYIGKYLDTGTHHIFALENYSIAGTVIYRDKHSGNLKGGTDADYITGEIPPIMYPRGVSGTYFISIHWPEKQDSLLSNSSIISGEDKLKIKDLREDDNPVLVFFQLKDF